MPAGIGAEAMRSIIARVERRDRLAVEEAPSIWRITHAGRPGWARQPGRENWAHESLGGLDV